MSTPNGTHGPTGQQADIDMDALYSWVAPQTPPPQPCPEALFSATLRGKLGGVEILLTVRGQTGAEFRTNLEAIKGLLDALPTPAPVSPPPAAQGPGEGWCAIHNTEMPQTTKDGRSWYSHKTADGWCKGTVRR